MKLLRCGHPVLALSQWQSTVKSHFSEVWKSWCQYGKVKG
ncbi:hypothetical protein BFJ71_g6599 [Fusarium oxysporum]|nr:hypothetical protein BFJ71_g6599 [Fusarium oxysporum]